MQWLILYRFGRAGCICLLAVLVLLIPVLSVAAASSAVDRQHERAVELARKGRTADAVQLLQRLHANHPNNHALTGDLIVVLIWDGRFTEGIRLFETRSFSWPSYVESAVVQGYRSLGRFETALKLQDRLLAADPGNPGLLIRRALLLIDLGRVDEAEQVLSSLAAREVRDRDFYLARAYLEETSRDWFAVLNAYHAALRIQADDRDLHRKVILALNRVRAPSLALIKEEGATLLNRQELVALLNSRAAELLRWSTTGNRDFRETRLWSLKALSLQLQALSLLATTPQDKKLRRQLKLDLVITMRTLRRMEDVQLFYAELAREGPMPDYVRQALADSLLATRKPEESAEIYKQLAEKKPGNYQANYGLFYSLIEQENFEEAYGLIDSMAAREPMFRTYWDSRANYPNPTYLDLQVAALQARFYADQLNESWERIDRLVSRAPRNNWLLEVRGQINAARDWPRQALIDFRNAGLIEPDSLDARIGRANSLIRLHCFKEARPLLEDLQRIHPREHGVRELAKSWRFARKPSFWGDVVYSNSSGPELNGDGLLATAEVISSPIDDVWLLNAGYRYAWSELIEGEETFRRERAGLEYKRGNWDILAHLHNNHSGVSELGGKLKIGWKPDDFWRFSLAGERFGVSTPLRALYHGIRADSLTGSLGWRASEMQEISLGVQGSSFTDGNDRIEGSLMLRRRLIDIPHLDIDGRLDLYGSSNSTDNVPYYSPLHDFRIEGSVHVDHIYYRWYDQAFVQMLDAGYGMYEQKGYGSRWVGHIRYEHRYRLAPRLEMLAGFEFGQNVYDGEAEPYRLVRFMINGKF